MTHEKDPQTAITAEEFIRWITPDLIAEAHFTEENNEACTIRDYIADLATWCQRMVDGEVEFDVDAEGRQIVECRHVTGDMS